MSNLRIIVQPPPQAQTNDALYPPIVAGLSTHRSDEVVNYFAMAFLVDASGQILDQGLGGTALSDGQILHGSRHDTVVFVFQNLSILYEGFYMIRVDVFENQPTQALFVDQAWTKNVVVSSVEVARHRPSSDERSFLKRLREAHML